MGLHKMNHHNDLITPDVMSSSDQYARRFSGPVGQWFLDVQAQCVTSMVGKKSVSVLDVGGGHGQLTGALLEGGHKVTILGSPNAPTERIRNFIDMNRVTYVTGSFLSLPFADRSFDIVVCFRILTHLSEWKQCCSELCRVARHSVIIDFPCSRSLNALTALLFTWKKGIEKDTREYILFKRREMKDVFSAQSLKVVEEKGQFFWPMVVHRSIKMVHFGKLLEGMASLCGLHYLFGSPVIMKATRET
jgi:2-polyprenyl-3-methyl-5-hydroxy-6-metoxy-1,4-benzoquinol methylase